MHAVLRKRLATKPAALSVGMGMGVGCVRDIVADGGGTVFRGDECWLLNEAVSNIQEAFISRRKGHGIVESQCQLERHSKKDLSKSTNLSRFKKPNLASARIFGIKFVCPMPNH